MIDFLLTLLFSSTVMLVGKPIDISGSLDVKLDHPVSALTGEAAIQVEVSNSISPSLPLQAVASSVTKIFPINSIRASLSQSNGNTKADFSYRGQFIQTKEGVRLVLEGVTAVPVRGEFDKLQISSDHPIFGVRLFWRNTGHL